MNHAMSTLGEAEREAKRLACKLKTPFSVVFDYAFDGVHDWHIYVGKAKRAEFIAE